MLGGQWRRCLSRPLGLSDIFDHLFVIFGWLTCLHKSGQIQIIFCVPIFLQQAYLARIGISGEELELNPLDEWNVDVVGGWAQVLIFLASEDVQGHDVGFSVSVLSSL